MKKKTIVGIVLGVVVGVIAYYCLVLKQFSEWKRYLYEEHEEDEYDEDFDYEDLDEEYAKKCREAGCCNQ